MMLADTPIPDPLSSGLRPIRLSAGHSLGHVARTIGVSTPYLSGVERGLRRVSRFIAAVYIDMILDRLGSTTKESWVDEGSRLV